MGIESHPAYPVELERLKETLREANTQYADLLAQAGIEGEELNEEAMEAIRAAAVALEQMRIERLHELKTARLEPYFGRVDFQERGKQQESFYIGKVGLEKESRPYVIDWRAPVATLFYSAGTEGESEAWYEAPEGIIQGAVHLKRNLGVKGGQLQRIVDSKLDGGEQVIDEFLQYRLEESRDNRLRDIVSTIQKEQNEIIRADKDGPVIIQGVAGSGKTTVALHRIAYLLYKYRESMSANRIVIFAPNRMFLDYISDVLPELGVGGITQTTFSDWAIDQLDFPVKLTRPGPRLARWFAPGQEPAVDGVATARFKGSLFFKEVLNRALMVYEDGFVPDADLTLWEGARIKAATIRNWFYEQYAGQPVYARKERCIARAKRWVDDQIGLFRGTMQEVERRKTARTAVQRWVDLWPNHTALELYRQILGAPPARKFKVAQVGAPDIPIPVVMDSLSLFERDEIAPEDLAPLVHLQSQLVGLKDQKYLDHVVIDEAQDFSPLQVDLLQALTPTQSFTILGDLSQGIHVYAGISGWEELMEVFDTPPDTAAPDLPSVRYFTLEQSYRSTYEVMTYANAIINQAGAPAALARPVFRAGARVRVGARKASALGNALRSEINRLRERGHVSIAIIARTEKETTALAKLLQQGGVEANLITAEQAEYKGGVSVITSYMAKGLEFDAVIVPNASAEFYQPEPRDARLLYVACTRALHELTIFYVGEPSPLVAGVDPALYEQI